MSSYILDKYRNILIVNPVSSRIQPWAGVDLTVTINDIHIIDDVFAVIKLVYKLHLTIDPSFKNSGRDITH